MKFFFADNLDYIDPSYDFINENQNPDRIPQVDDLYPHEYFDSPPYDGLLVSYNCVGSIKNKSKYTKNQRIRFWREGVRNFIRYPYKGYDGNENLYPIMGDCGAFSYIDKEKPIISNQEVIEFYQSCRFTHGVSVDHIIVNKKTNWDNEKKRPKDISYRADITSKNALDFFDLCNKQKVSFTPIGVIQFWSPESAIFYAKKLVDIGYNYIGLGGLVGQPVEYVKSIITELRSTIPNYIKIHIFGFTAINKLDKFVGLGVSSFDSTSPMLKAFKDDKSNYYVDSSNKYIAIRVPKVFENRKIRQKIQSGALSQEKVNNLEGIALNKLRGYAKGRSSLEDTLSSVLNYELYTLGEKNNAEKYFSTLKDKPWEKCKCKICLEIGVEVLIYRCFNRNKRRGFHNLWKFFEYKNRIINDMKNIEVPCIKIKQNASKYIYSFVVNGKDISKFASVSRISRDKDSVFTGYQRPEVADHIRGISQYIDKSDSILPNSIVVAFNGSLQFTSKVVIDSDSSMGILHLPFGNDKIGWIVDGQQRSAALRTIKKERFPVSVVGFESKSTVQEREQFILINNTKPLPSSLIHELLPRSGNNIPSKYIKRQKAYCLLEKLNFDKSSPFYHRIKCMTTAHIETCNIQDTSVLKMIENSMSDGILNRYRNNDEKAYLLLKTFWNAVKEYYNSAWLLSPKKSRLTHGTGVKSMGYIMDAVSYKVIKKSIIPKKDKFLLELELLGNDLPWTQGYWVFSDDFKLPWNEVNNIPKHVDLVTNYLIRKYRHISA